MPLDTYRVNRGPASKGWGIEPFSGSSRRHRNRDGDRLTKSGATPCDGGVIQSGILNPHLLALLARVRHTNTIVIADSMFPSWPGLVEVDLSLVYGIPTIPQVLSAVLANWKCGAAWMASEFEGSNDSAVRDEFRRAFGAVPLVLESHRSLKLRVPRAMGLIRTGEARIYTNVVLESA